MKKTIALLTLSLFLLMGVGAKAQKLNEWLKTKKDEAKSKVNSKVDQKASSGMDDALNKPEEMIKNKKEKNKDKKGSSAVNNSSNSTKNSESNSSNENNTETPSGKKPATLQYYSKFDFVPGENIVAVEDFSQDAMGDFPDRWNTNYSGDLVNVEGKAGT